MRLSKILTCFALLILFGFACRDQGVEPPIDTNKIKLTLIDTSVREVYIHIYVGNPLNSQTIKILRNGVEARSFPAAITDTMFADTGLTANTIYTYQALIQVNGRTLVKSNPISVQTLQSTSRNFTWQTFTLGDGNSSFLQDIFVLNDTLAYVVGEIYVKDSTGQFETEPYNIARWDGKTWTIQKIQVPVCGTNYSSPFPLYVIYAFAPDNILVSGGGYRTLEW